MRASETEVTRTERPSPSLEFGDLTAPRMLLVSGEVEPSQTLSDYFSTSGFEISRADNIEDALAILAVHGAAIVLVDLRLSDHDGFDLLSAIRHTERWRDLPVMVISPDERDQVKVRALEAGADDCVAAPVHPNELQARVRALLRRNRRGSV